jgi:hypothetical protein
MKDWSGSLPRNRFEKQIYKDPCHWKEIKKASEGWSRDAETRLQERVSMGIEKKSREMLEKCKNHIKTRK